MKRIGLLATMLVAWGVGSAQAAVTISGTVRDTAGKVLDSVRLSLQVPGGNTIARDTTGPDGTFGIVSDSTQGKLVLRATSMGSTSYTTKSDTIVLSGRDTAGIVVRMVPVPAPVKSSVSGKIDSAGSATVLSGAVVTLRGTGRWTRVRSVERGLLPARERGQELVVRLPLDVADMLLLDAGS